MHWEPEISLSKKLLLFGFFFEGFGHDVAGVRGEAGAFKLDGSVFDAEICGGFGLDGLQDALAFVHVHIGEAGVQA